MFYESTVSVDQCRKGYTVGRMKENEKNVLTVAVFDFDGVIADSMPAQARAWRQAVEAVISDATERQAAQAAIERNLFLGCAGEQMFQGLELDSEIKRAMRMHKDTLWTAEQRDVPVFPDVVAVVSDLKDRYTLAIATSAARGYVEYVLAREGLLNLFHIFTNEDVAHPKPAPDLLTLIMSTFNTTGECVFMVGDTNADYIMAKNAGCRFMHFASNEQATLDGVSEIVIRDWMELRGALLQPQTPA